VPIQITPIRHHEGVAARSWLRRQRDRGNLAAVVLVGCLVFILPGVPLWLRIPLALLAGVVFRKEMDWERRSPANLRRASRLLAVTTGWWISTFGLMCALVALTPVVHGCRPRVGHSRTVAGGRSCPLRRRAAGSVGGRLGPTPPRLTRPGCAAMRYRTPASIGVLGRLSPCRGQRAMS